jgi:hypothetical protein
MAMTLRLAGFQHFCARFTDAFLTSLSPLTYERGDYSDGTEKLDPDYEPTSTHALKDACQRYWDAESYSEAADALADMKAAGWADPLDSEAAASPAASATPAPVDGTPPASPGAGLSFVDYMTPAIWDVLAVHMPIRFHVTEFGINHFRCECGYDFPGVGDGQDWREHVGELIAERIERAGGKR